VRKTAKQKLEEAEDKFNPHLNKDRKKELKKIKKMKKKSKSTDDSDYSGEEEETVILKKQLLTDDYDFGTDFNLGELKGVLSVDDDDDDDDDEDDDDDDDIDLDDI
jgi:hypothetical protein